MKAKLIKEISRDKYSGLSAMGVGKANVLKSYDVISKVMPSKLNENSITLDKVFKSVIDNIASKIGKERVTKYLDVLQEYSNEPLENFLCADIYANDFEEKEQDEIERNGIDVDDVYELFDDERSDEMRVTFSSKLTYSRKNKLGFFYCYYPTEKHYVRIHYMFVKSK